MRSIGGGVGEVALLVVSALTGGGVCRRERGRECQPGGETVDPAAGVPRSGSARRGRRTAEGHDGQHRHVAADRRRTRPGHEGFPQSRHRDEGRRPWRLPPAEVSTLHTVVNVVM